MLWRWKRYLLIAPTIIYDVTPEYETGRWAVGDALREGHEARDPQIMDRIHLSNLHDR